MSVLADGLTSSHARSSDSDSDSGTAAERLTDDLLLEILSRVPAKSLSRFKCVSNHWLSLIDHPNHRKKLPQALAGFFYGSRNTGDWLLKSPFHFTSALETRCRTVDIDISFRFLPNHRRVDLLDCCNGLLLCRWYDISTQGDEFRYVVFNPATEKWVMFPDSGQASSKVVTTRLGFDPVSSSHFHVFELVQDNLWGPDLAGVAVYSSETGEWVYKAKTWNQRIRLIDGQSATIFFNGYLHFLATDGRELYDCLAVVDTKGETWMKFRVPDGLVYGFIQRSQGQLHYANFQREDDDMVWLVVYVLENYQSKEWILKYRVETSYGFGGIGYFLEGDLAWIAIHPECDLIFFTTGSDIQFVCYNKDSWQPIVISNTEEGTPPYLPYVPLYAELPLLHI